MDSTRDDIAAPDAAAASTERDDEWLASPLRSLPLELTIRLAEGSARVGDVAEWSPGEVVPLTTSVGTPACLVCGDRIVARGELVAGRSGIALRLTELGNGRA